MGAAALGRGYAITGLLATAATGAEDIGREEVYVAYDTAARLPDDVGVTVLRVVWSSSLANDRALSFKKRLTAITFALLFSSMLLIGALNLTCATLH